jgi:hypothetical protein
MVKSKKSFKAFSFSITAASLIIINAVLLGVVAKWFIGIMPILPGSSGNDPELLLGLSTVGLVLGFTVLFGAIMLRLKPTHKRAWGIVVLAFSAPSVIMGGGLIIGFILGIAGGALALSRKPAEKTKNEYPENKMLPLDRLRS